MKLRFALGVFTERILDYVLSCRCQVVGNSEFFGGVMLSTILPAWLTTIFHLGSVSSVVKCPRAPGANVSLDTRPCPDTVSEAAFQSKGDGYSRLADCLGRVYPFGTREVHHPQAKT